MLLHGSCHCGAVKFSIQSYTPYPYMCCYCSICRKTAGGGGYAINIMGEADTLQVEGRTQITVYQAHRRAADGTETSVSPARRHFCSHCGSALWISDPRWPQWIYPFASAIDTPLPVSKEHVHLMLNFAASWVEIPAGPHDVYFPEYPEETIVDWHKRRSLYELHT
ncbi:MAG: GFA family protein [Acidiferrobacterales bacterium]